MLNTKETLIVQQLLKDYASELSHNCCNDWNFPESWTVIKKQEFLKEFYAWNGSPDDYSPTRLIISDSSVSHFLSAKMISKDLGYSLKLSKYDCSATWLLNYITPEQQTDLLQSIENYSGSFRLDVKPAGGRTTFKLFTRENDYLIDLTDYDIEK